MKTFLKVLAGILAAALIAYGVGWGVTDNYNPAEWGKGKTEASASGAPIENGGAGSAQLLSSEASTQSDDKAAFDAAVNEWVLSNSLFLPEYFKYTIVTEEVKNYFTVGNNIVDKTYWAYGLDTNFAVVKCVDTADMSITYYLFIRTGNIFPEFSYPFVDITQPSRFVTSRNFTIPGYKVFSYKYTYESAETISTHPVQLTYNFDPEAESLPLPEEPTKEGYTFVGWYLDEALTQPYDGQKITADMQFYAKFRINTYTVTLDTDGGNSLAAVKVDWNTAPELTAPEKTGYNFVGWYLADGTKYEGAGITEDITLTAHWEIKTFTVTFYVNGEVYTTMTVEYGTRLWTVADSAKVFANNIISFRNANKETPDISASEMTISDDMIVLANEPTIQEKIINSRIVPIIIAVIGAALMVATAATIGVNRKKKDRR